MLIGYARVPTEDKSLDLQLDAFARDNCWSCCGSRAGENLRIFSSAYTTPPGATLLEH